MAKLVVLLLLVAVISPSFSVPRNGNAYDAFRSMVRIRLNLQTVVLKEGIHMKKLMETLS